VWFLVDFNDNHYRFFCGWTLQNDFAFCHAFFDGFAFQEQNQEPKRQPRPLGINKFTGANVFQFNNLRFKATFNNVNL
jgi:hypothetical protein